LINPDSSEHSTRFATYDILDISSPIFHEADIEITLLVTAIAALLLPTEHGESFRLATWGSGSLHFATWSAAYPH
jgi:hypothetical protein